MKNVNLSKNQSMQVLRYANRVPLQFQTTAYAITQAIIGTNWRAYGLKLSTKRAESVAAFDHVSGAFGEPQAVTSESAANNESVNLRIPGVRPAFPSDEGEPGR